MPWLVSLLVACGGPFSGPPLPGDTSATASDPEPDPAAACTPDPGDPQHDADGDRLWDFEEMELGTDLCLRDTDGDGQTDYVEYTWGGAPLDPTVTAPGHFVEVREASAAFVALAWPLRVRSADVALLLDTTASMGPLADAMAAEFQAITGELAASLPDATYGLATYDDYAYGNYGHAERGDRPFTLLQPQTDDPALITAQLQTLELHYGADGPESAMEALTQVLTGRGWDQNCDGTYDPTTDIRPFAASAADAFSGAIDGSPIPAAGTRGGMGFRRGALPIVVYATDAELRDPAGGFGAPTGCLAPADSHDVEAAAHALGARLIAISVSSWNGPGYPQMSALAAQTNSYGDLDGDGIDEPMVARWWGSDDDFRDTVVGAVRQVVGAITFDELRMVWSGSGTPFVSSVSPDAHHDVRASEHADEPLPYTMTFTGISPALVQDQFFELDVTLQSDGGVQLGQQRVVIIVPGTGM